jgi:hypothetical protein
MNPLTTGMLVVVGVALAAWLLRRFSGDGGIDREMLSGRAGEPGRVGAPAAAPEDEVEHEVEDEVEDAGGPGQIAAITSDGLMFIPFEQGVQLLVPASREELAQELVTQAVSRGRVAGMLSCGDLGAARVVRGAPGVDPWRLEALGRDREYLAWSFETEEAARAALELLERIVVRAPMGADGEPLAAAAAEFAQARQIHDETEQELAMMPDVEEPEEPR